ncbi:MAG: hypothetical protein RL477_2122 [Pseudomonadota bacterium]|jgi:hypothetical protein
MSLTGRTFRTLAWAALLAIGLTATWSSAFADCRDDGVFGAATAATDRTMAIERGNGSDIDDLFAEFYVDEGERESFESREAGSQPAPYASVPGLSPGEHQTAEGIFLLGPPKTGPPLA